MRLFLTLLVIVIISILLGMVIMPYAFLLTEPVSDGRS